MTVELLRRMHEWLHSRCQHPNCEQEYCCLIQGVRYCEAHMKEVGGP